MLFLKKMEQCRYLLMNFLCVGDDALAHLEEKKRVTLFFATGFL